MSLSNVGAVLSSLQSAMRQALLVIAYVRMPSSDETPDNGKHGTQGKDRSKPLLHACNGSAANALAPRCPDAPYFAS